MVNMVPVGGARASMVSHVELADAGHPTLGVMVLALLQLSRGAASPARVPVSSRYGPKA